MPRPRRASASTFNARASRPGPRHRGTGSSPGAKTPGCPAPTASRTASACTTPWRPSRTASPTASSSTAWALGATVYAVDLGEVPRDDPDDPMRTALRQMVGVFAQLERGTVVARLRAGRRRKHELGGYAFGAPAYGQRTVEGVLVPDETE